jgi:hypothetical protein
MNFFHDTILMVRNIEVQKRWHISEMISMRLLLKMINQWMALHFSPCLPDAVGNDLVWQNQMWRWR